MKQGPKPRGGTNPHAARYYAEGYPLGLTIAEWEARNGLPLFTVWPEAEHARKPSDPGRFLYCKATEKEREELGSVQLHWAVRPTPRSEGTAVLSASSVVGLSLHTDQHSRAA